MKMQKKFYLFIIETKTMLTVCLKPLYHRQKENIAICYPNNNEVNIIVRKLKDVRWSQANKCWYLPLSKASHEAIREALKGAGLIDDSLLRQYLEKKKQVAKTVVTSKPELQTANRKPQTASPAWKLGKENIEALQKFVEQLKLKAYSESTIKTYRGEFLQLLQLLKKKPVYELTPDDLRRYMLYCFEKLHLTENTLHSRINAIKFYFEQVRGREKFFWEIPRPKKKTELPKMFSQDEVAAIINSTSNKKHKTMLMLATVQA